MKMMPPSSLKEKPLDQDQLLHWMVLRNGQSKRSLMNAPEVEESSTWFDGKVGVQKQMNGCLTETWTRLKHLTNGKPRDKKNFNFKHPAFYRDTLFFFANGEGCNPTDYQSPDSNNTFPLYSSIFPLFFHIFPIHIFPLIHVLSRDSICFHCCTLLIRLHLNPENLVLSDSSPPSV
jgi:hypothetical protein